MTDPLAWTAAVALTRDMLTDVNRNLTDWLTSDPEEHNLDVAGLTEYLLGPFETDWEIDGTGLRRLVLRGPWEADPRADTR